MSFFSGYLASGIGSGAVFIENTDLNYTRVQVTLVANAAGEILLTLPAIYPEILSNIVITQRALFSTQSGGTPGLFWNLFYPARLLAGQQDTIPVTAFGINLLNPMVAIGTENASYGVLTTIGLYIDGNIVITGSNVSIASGVMTFSGSGGVGVTALYGGYGMVNFTITSTGTIAAAPATTTTPGVVTIGSGLAVTNGTISATGTLTSTQYAFNNGTGVNLGTVSSGGTVTVTPTTNFASLPTLNNLGTLSTFIPILYSGESAIVTPQTFYQATGESISSLPTVTPYLGQSDQFIVLQQGSTLASSATTSQIASAYKASGPVYWVNAPAYLPSGATFGTGQNQPLSTFYSTLSAAQAKYPFATALWQQMDACAIQLALNNLYPTSISTTFTFANPVVTVASTTGIVVGGFVTGPGIFPNTYVQSISGNSVTLTQGASGTGTNPVNFFATAIPCGTVMIPPSSPIINFQLQVNPKYASLIGSGPNFTTLYCGGCGTTPPIYLSTILNPTNPNYGFVNNQLVLSDFSITCGSGTVVATTTATTTNGNNTITVASASSIVVGGRVLGAGLGNNSFVVAISGTTITLTANAVASASGVSVTFYSASLTNAGGLTTSSTGGSVSGGYVYQSSAIQIDSLAEATIQRLSISGFDNTIAWGSYAFIILLEECNFSGNNKGISWPQNLSASTLGENIRYVNCSSANNNYNVYMDTQGTGSNGLGIDIVLDKCSLDYHNVAAIYYVGTPGAICNSRLLITNSHIETTALFSGTKIPMAQVFRGRLQIVNSILDWNDNTPTYAIIDAAGQPQTATTATVTASSTTIVVASATGLATGQIVVGAGIPPVTTISAISGTTITLSAAATISGVYVPIQTFSTGAFDAYSEVAVSYCSFTGYTIPCVGGNILYYTVNGNTVTYPGIGFCIASTSLTSSTGTPQYLLQKPQENFFVANAAVVGEPYGVPPNWMEGVIGTIGSITLQLATTLEFAEGSSVLIRTLDSSVITVKQDTGTIQTTGTRTRVVWRIPRNRMSRHYRLQRELLSLG